MPPLAPSPSVLAAFGEPEALPRLLPGGQGTSWRAGRLVLKPAAASEEATLAWIAQRLAPAAAEGDLRIALPIRASTGALVHEGWSATRFLEGAAPDGRWEERADVARRFASAFREVDPSTLPRRTDVFARADRAAWGEERGPLTDHPLVGALRPLPVPVESRLVHGDIASNTLHLPGRSPAVIDLSLYARPVEWSVAVLAVDVVAFKRAPLGTLRTLSDHPAFPQLLVRALLFRIGVDALLGLPPRPEWGPVTSAVLAAAA